MNYWSVIYRFACIALVAIFVAGVVCIFLPKCRSYGELQRKKTQLEQETKELDAAVNRLQMQKRQFQSDSAFVERTARENGMVKPGETVFKVSREEARAPGR